MAVPEPQLEHPAKADAKSARQTWRVLFLDAAENVQRLKEACKEAGYVVVGATTIEAAWAFLDGKDHAAWAFLDGKDHADVIVCAAHLEEESMFDFLRAVRVSPLHAGARFLILSLEASAIGARADRSAARTGVLLGADTYVIMTVFDPALLVAEIKKLQPAVPMLQQSATAEEKRRSE